MLIQIAMGVCSFISLYVALQSYVELFSNI